MNNARRKKIAAAQALIENCLADLQSALDELTEVRDEEQESFDNLPEGLQQSDQGQRAEEAVEILDTVIEAQA